MPRWPAGLRAFVAEHGVETRAGEDGEEFLVFYKAVRRGYRPWHDMHQPKDPRARPYAPGTLVRTRSFNRDRRTRCGGGLHICPLRQAAEWTGRKRGKWAGLASAVIEVLVKPADIVVPKQFGSTGPKLRCRELLVARRVPKREWEEIKCP
jgi:hypothetical protein